MARDNFVVDLSVSDATQRHTLGMIYIEPSGFFDRDSDTAGVGSAGDDQGEREWVYIDAAGGVTPVQGNVMERPDGSTTYDACILADLINTPSMKIPGVAQYAFTTASDFGFVLKRGKGAALSDSAIVADAALAVDVASAAGRVADPAASAASAIGTIGLSLTGAVGAAVLIDAWLNCLGA